MIVALIMNKFLSEESQQKTLVARVNRMLHNGITENKKYT